MVSAATSAITGVVQGQTAEDKAVLGKDDFLRLLITQLRYQDPLNPMQGSEFASQLAQFSSVEQLANINTNLSSSLDANHLLTSAISNALSATIIGKDVRASGTDFHYSGEGEARLGVTLTSAAESVRVTIYSHAGRAVRTVDLGSAVAGDTTFPWDGLDNAGAAVAAGSYTFAVQATDADGGSMTTEPYIYGTVSAVRFRPGGTMFVVDGVEVSMSDILEIINR
jgi:flagellar basal-body rod modification protein FlgD